MKYLMKSKCFTESKTYIKTYEDLENAIQYTITDLIKIPYWRLKHATTDSMFRINKFWHDYTWKTNFDITFYNLDVNNTFHTGDFWDEQMMRKLLKIEDNKIIRPATPEEIEQFDLAEMTKKYNVF